jgi:hypothetical protein
VKGEAVIPTHAGTQGGEARGEARGKAVIPAEGGEAVIPAEAGTQVAALLVDGRCLLAGPARDRPSQRLSPGAGENRCT